MRTLTLRPLLPFALALLAGPSLAQTTLTGIVFDGAGGPLLAGQVYHSNGPLTVPVGETLTIQPGAILKLSPTAVLQVSGTLTSPAGAPAYITSLRDDSVGGDSNGDGPSAGAKADWSGIRAFTGGLVDLRDTVITFAGYGSYCPIHVEGGVVNLVRCTLAESDGAGIDGNGYDVGLTVVDTHIENCNGPAMEAIRAEQVPNFAGNTAAGNGNGDAIRLSLTNLDRDTSITAGNLIGNVLVLQAPANVLAGTTLSIGPDVAIKLTTGTLLEVYGTLSSIGTAVAPVTFTALDDDSVFGDTASDGATPVGPGEWFGVRSRPGGLVHAEHTVFRYAGGGNYAALYASGGEFEVYDCIIEQSLGNGLTANSNDTRMVVERTAFLNNGGWAMSGVRIERVPEFSSNTAAGNALGDTMWLAFAGPNRDTTITVDDLLGDTLVNTVVVRPIPSGVTLEFGPGAVVKNAGSNIWDVSGTLRLAGTQLEPVTFTGIADDAVGGDIANDGATSGSAGDWYGIRCHANGLVDANHTLVRFAGGGNYSGFYGGAGRFDLRYCAVEHSLNAGIDFNGYDVAHQVVACRFDDNTGVAMDDAQIGFLPGLDSNTGTGNLGGDFVRSTVGAVSGVHAVSPRNLINATLVAPFSFTVNEGAELTFEAGTLVKTGPSMLVTVQGKLVARGTATAPVFFSSFDDDTMGGDTNLDGPSLGSPNSWYGLRAVPITGGPGVLELEHVLIRNGGLGVGNVQLTGSGNVLRSVRSEASGFHGFLFLGVVNSQVVNCVAFDNFGSGFNLSGSSFQLTHATASGNTFGVTATTGGATIKNSVVWGNINQMNLSPATLVEHTTSKGVFAGIGNSTLDPQFVDAPNGDLRLALGSPAVDAAHGQTALAVGRDAVDASRLLAPVGATSVKADMGAYEQARWSLSMSGSAAIGGVLTFGVDGDPGVAVVSFSTKQTSLLIPPFGMLLIGPVPIFELGLVAVGSSLPLYLPNEPVLIGLELGVQALALDGAGLDQAQLTDVERPRIETALP